MRLAIIKLSAMGDIIHAMIVLQFIKQHKPEIDIDWIVEESYKELLEFNPEINKVHTVNLKNAKKEKSLNLFLKELRKLRQFGHYDLVVDMQGLLKSAVVSRIIPSIKTLGFDKISLRESLAAKFYNQTINIDYSNNIIDRNIDFASQALELSIIRDDILNKQPFLYSSQKYTFNAISNTKQNIVLIPGASYPSKSYPVEKFAELTTLIDANFLVIWGHDTEKEMADKIKILSPEVHVLRKISLDELISLISQVDLLIGPDTGPTHMAWALNIPSITLFGPTPGYRNTYATEINKFIESKSKVNPLKIDKNDYSIKNINVSDIVKISNLFLKVYK